MTLWREEMWEIHCRAIGMYKMQHTPGSEEDIRFLMLGLAGEVGELANLIKKAWRDGTTKPRRGHIREEYGDVLAYLSLLGRALEIHDESLMQDLILPKCRARWPAFPDTSGTPPEKK